MTDKINLKSPICCVLGHVDDGKTTFLDKIRNTNIQDKEAGGITQQMGATFFSKDTLIKQTKNILHECDIRVPGLLIMDTPGHEMFSNMRDRGSSICNLALVVIDIMHGMKKQTYESIELLQNYKTPFIVLLTKVDKIYQWVNGDFDNIEELLKKQEEHVLFHFWNKVNDIIAQLNSLGLNAELFHLNKNKGSYVSMIPVSSITGDGFPDVFNALINLSQKFMIKKLTYREKVRCIVLEVRDLAGVGKTIDVILANGSLNVGDRIFFLTSNGYKKSIIKRIYIPPESKEIREKSNLIQCECIQASASVKIFADDLDDVVAGHPLYIINDMSEDEIIELGENMVKELRDMLVTKHQIGLHLQTSSMGSMEAISNYLEEKGINVATKGLGKMHKKDALKVFPQIEKSKSKRYHVVLAFDVSVTKDAEEELTRGDIKIFTNNHVYTLVDEYEKYISELVIARNNHIKSKYKDDLQVPAVVKILPRYVFNKSNPIIFGVKIQKGVLYKNAILRTVVIDKDKNESFLEIGEVLEIRDNSKTIDFAKVGLDVSIKIKSNKNILYGRQFDSKNKLFTKMTKMSIKLLKKFENDYIIDKELLEELLVKNKVHI